MLSNTNAAPHLRRLDMQASSVKRSAPALRATFSTRRAASAVCGHRTVLAQAKSDGPSVSDRALSAIPYILPMMDGLQFGTAL